MLARDEETGEPMSDRQLRDEVMTLLIAGHETTASGLAWAWYLLDRHPDEQERLRAELTAAVGDRGPTVDNLPSLPRFRMVINETLRLYPPVWMFNRRALGPDQLGAFAIRRGDLVIISPYGIHRNPALWADPETFRPERFEPDHEEQKTSLPSWPSVPGPGSAWG
jgi:cytochrome P450